MIRYDDLVIEPRNCQMCGFCIRQMDCFSYGPRGLVLNRERLEELNSWVPDEIEKRMRRIVEFCKYYCVVPAIRFKEVKVDG